MRIIGLDTETTGLEQDKGHRIIEIAMLGYEFDPATGKHRHTDTYVQRIDPERSISPGAQEVHKITYAELVGQPKWNDVAQEISERLSNADLLVAHNMGFDGPFIGAELNRVGVKVPNTPSFCTKEDGRWACPDGKYPRLGELCFALGVHYDEAKAHSAEYDVSVMMECFFQAHRRGFYKAKPMMKQMDEQVNCYGREELK